VQHDLRPEALELWGDLRQLATVTVDVADARQQPSLPPAAVKDGHRVAGLGKFSDDMRADEGRSADHQNVHPVLLLFDSKGGSMQQFLRTAVVLICALLLAACGAGENDVEGALENLEGPHTEIIVRTVESGSAEDPSTAFQPPNVIAPPGATVVWIREDSAPHLISEGTPGELEPIFDEELPPGSYAMHTFTEPGTYTFYCKYHEAEVGEVRVEGVTPAAP
jgi:plastocyanin